MLLVVDANILVGELLRVKGQELLADKRLELYIAEKTLEEAQRSDDRFAELEVTA